MTWVLDIIAIFFVVFFSIYGLIKGSYYMVIDTLLVLVCIAGAAVGAFFTVQYGLTALGIVDGFSEVWVSILGASKVSGLQEILNQVAFFISYGLLTLVLFIIYNAILHALRGLLLKLFEGLRNNVGFIKFIGNLLGFIVNFAISAGIVLSVMAISHSFDNCAYLTNSLGKAFQASEVLSLLYDINPLNSIFEQIGPMVEELFTGFIG